MATCILVTHHTNLDLADKSFSNINNCVCFNALEIKRLLNYHHFFHFFHEFKLYNETLVICDDYTPYTFIEILKYKNFIK